MNYTATYALDTISEQFVQNTIKLLRENGKTIIIIAHRLSTVRFADQIIVLENGKLIESGITNNYLIKKANTLTSGLSSLRGFWRIF